MLEEIQSLLGAGTRYEGKLSFDGTARIDGTFEGEVITQGCLILGPEADIRAEMQVGALIVLGGTVRGLVQAQELVEIHKSAHVEADLRTPKLYVEEGARFEGRCAMSADGNTSVGGRPVDIESFSSANQKRKHQMAAS